MGRPTTRSEIRAVLRARLATWPVVDDATTQFLRSLHWRVRQVVILVYGERRTAAETAARLGVGCRTVWYDLSLADAQYQGAALQQHVPDLLDTGGVRHLAAAVVLQAWRDALDGGDTAPEAREWLRNHPWADTLCDGCGVDRQRLVERMDATLAERLN